jgi:hypothetical protein
MGLTPPQTFGSYATGQSAWRAVDCWWSGITNTTVCEMTASRDWPRADSAWGREGVADLPVRGSSTSE